MFFGSLNSIRDKIDCRQKIKPKSDRLLEKRRDVLTRYVQAYREAVEWMYSNPAALQRYAELADMSEGEAQQLRDEFFPKDMLLPGNIVGLNMIVKDAVVLGYLRKMLSRRGLRELVQIATPGRTTRCPARISVAYARSCCLGRSGQLGEASGRGASCPLTPSTRLSYVRPMYQ